MHAEQSELKADIIETLQSYRMERHVKPDEDGKKLRFKKEVTLDPEFQELWNRIKPKTTFAQRAPSVKLAFKCPIGHLNANLSYGPRGVASRTNLWEFSKLPSCGTCPWADTVLFHMQTSNGMNYAPQGKPRPVCQEGEFPIAAVSLDHGHIYGQCNGLREAGATVKWVFDPDPVKIENFLKAYPGCKPARALDEVLDDPEIRLVAAAAVPNLRGPLGCRVMQAGKDYFTDKTPFTTLSQLEDARKTAADTGKKYMVYFSERLHVECAMFAGELIAQDAIGRVVQVLGLGPHRLSAPSRPAWFFEKEKYGGILCDIGSHQIEQFLFYSGAKDATVTNAAVGNFGNPDHPELEDYGEANLIADNGTANFFRVDWFTPDGLGTWGDGRTLILGTKGYIEMRKYINVATAKGGDHLFLVNDQGEQHMELNGKVGFPFFGKLILDCLNRTENAMTQAHAFKAAELCIKAQETARRLDPR